MAFYDKDENHTSFAISFSPNPREDFGVFATGYRFAADTITRELIASGHFPDYKAYPIVFLYRHALELHLKNLIYRVAKLLFFQRLENVDAELYNCHNLVVLSKKAQSAILRAFPRDTALKELLEEVVQTSNEFSTIDPNSYSYRYPIAKNGKPSTPWNQLVGLHSMATHMSGLLEKLETIDFGLHIESDNAQEIYEIFIESEKSQ